MLILMIFIGSVSATETISNDNLISDENLAVEQYSAIDASGIHESDQDSEVLGAGDSEVLGADDGTFTDLHALIQGKVTINLTKDYKYDPEVDKQYEWNVNGQAGSQDYKYGIPIWDVISGFNHVKTITINGNGHTIDGNHLARMFNASHLGQMTTSGVNLVINNLTFVNGYVETDDPVTKGGAMIVGPYKVTVTLNNCTFKDNMAKNTNMGDPVGNESNFGAAWGGAIYINGISATDYSILNVNNCTFTNNTANYGGAIASASTHSVGRVNIKDSIFDDNHADSHPYNYSNGIYYFNGQWYSHGWGGAVYAYYTEVSNSTFTNNRGGNRSGFGGAISTYRGKFENSTFINNTCYQGGAIADGHVTHGTSAVDTGPSHYEISNCTFDNNKAQLSGGAVLTRNIGGYFYCDTGGDVVIDDCNFTNNYGGIYGGGAVMCSCPFISNTNFINNSVYNYGGAVSAGYAKLANVSFVNNSAAHSGALFCIEPYFNDNVTFDGNEINPRVLYDNGFTTNDTEVQDGTVIVASEWTLAQRNGYYWYYDLDDGWKYKIGNLPSMYQYEDSDEMNKGIGYYGFEYEVDLYGHAIEYDHKDVKGGYGQVSPGGAEGIVTDDLSYLINYIDGRELEEYMKILYYLCNLNSSFMNGAFRNEEAGELALEFPIQELCYSDLSNPINELMENITKIYDSGFRVPDHAYKLSDVLKDHMAHTDVMVPDNADEILQSPTNVIYRMFLYIVPFYHTNYLCYYQTNITIEKQALNKTVILGDNEVQFRIKVKNGGNYSVHNVYIIDKYYSEELIYQGYVNETGEWSYNEAEHRWDLVSNNGTINAAKTEDEVSIILKFILNETAFNKKLEGLSESDRANKTLMEKIRVLNNTAVVGFENTTDNATNNTTVIIPDMKLEKITMNKTVYLGEQTMFKIRVTNTGEIELNNILIKEIEYDEGLVLADWKGDWPWFANIPNNQFVYFDTLKPNESAEFIVIFNTTSVGNKSNYIVGSSDKTKNKTANNTTEVIPIMVNVSKVWNDTNDQDGIRPGNVTVYLMADGDKINETVLSEDNDWKFTFKGLALMNNGKVINYTFTEVPIDDYTMNITDDGNGSFVITNTHIPFVTDINVIKVWNDSENQSGIRPSEVKVELFAGANKINETVLSKDNGWSASFTDLPVNDAGVPIEYSIREVSVDGYTVVITNDTMGNFTITNTYVPNVTSINVVKVWNDSDDQDGIRPSEVTVELFAGANKINETVLSKDNGWSASFTGLPVYDNGVPIEYSIAEITVEGYDVVITNDTMGNFTITNTHIPENPDMKVEKITLNKTVYLGNQTMFKIRITNTGDCDLTNIIVEEVKYDEGLVLADWKGDEPWFGNINTEKFIYMATLKPTESAEFIVIFNTTKTGNFTNYVVATNNKTDNKTSNNTTEVLKPITINVVKVWNDTEDQDGIRPDNVTVELLADGNKIDEAILSEENQWSASFTGLPISKDGNTIVYSIREVPVDGYDVVITNDTMGNFTLTNIHVITNKPDIGVRKISLHKSVYLGTPVAFIVVVTNTGNCDLTGVYVIDNDFTEGIVLDHMEPNSLWTFDGVDKFTYNPDVLYVGESANFTIWFNTTSIGNKTNNVTADSNETPEVNSTNKTHVYVGNMSVRKISLNESVYLGNQVGFIVVVTNTGDCDLPGVYVVDNDFTEGIVLDHMVPNADWTFDGVDRFTYNPAVLPVGESANFTIWFNTTSVGDKINNVTAGNDLTPEVNSSNKTHVYVGNMSVRKISLNESVYLGNQVGFIVVVTNTGDCDLPGVYVVDNDFTDGIVLDHMVPNADWTFDGVDRFTYNPAVLAVGESANFTIWFNTTSVGDKINNVTAGNDLTPEVNSSNKTHVYVGNMSVRKISLNESVYLGNQVGFIVVVTNTGDCDLPGVYVVDNDFTDGIVLDHMVPNADWTFDGVDRFTYNPAVLAVGESANFTIWFNTTSVGDKINNVTAGNDLTPEVNSSNKTHVYVGDMTVRKISNNESVKVGEQVSFTIVVKNTGGCDLTGVYVIDNDYTSGLVYDHFVDSTNKWNYEGDGKWTFTDVLGIGKEAAFDVIFNTTTIGVKNNNVTAGNNITNETVNSTNKTNVTNETVPPKPDVPPQPEVPPKHEVPPEKAVQHETGNPLFALLFALMAMAVIPIRRRKQ